MNYLDIIIILLLIWGGWKGFRKGLIIELFTLFALFLGLYAGIHFSDYVADQMSSGGIEEKSYTPVVAFIITFLAVGAMVYFGGKAIEKVVKVAQLSAVNKILGIALGVLKMCFFVGTSILIIESMDDRSDILDESTKDGSLLYHTTKSVVTVTIPAFKESSLLIKESLRDGNLLEENETESDINS